MKKLGKLKLNKLNKNELEKRELDFVKGGYGCDCTCWCSCNCYCPCGGWPFGEEITDLNSDQGGNITDDKDGMSSVMSLSPEF